MSAPPARVNARGAIEGRLHPEDLDLDRRFRAAWTRVLDEHPACKARLVRTPARHAIYHVTRRDARHDPFAAAATLIVWMGVAGYPESAVTELLAELESVKRAVYGGAAHRSLDEIDRQEAPLDGAEDEAFTRRRVPVDGAPCTPDQLREEAATNRRLASVQLERADALEREARKLERQRPASGSSDRVAPRVVITRADTRHSHAED